MHNTHQNGYVKLTGTREKKWKGFYQRKVDGKWVKCSKILGTKAEMSKGAAKDALAAFIRGEGAGNLAPYAKRVTFAEATVRYLALKQSDWSVGNRVTMRGMFRKRILPVLGNKHVADILPSDCKEFFGSIAAEASESLLAKVVTHTRAVLDMLVEDDIIPKNPAKSRLVTIPKAVKAVCERYLTVEESRALLAIATGRDYVILRIMLACALRPSEVFALRLEDVEPGRLQIDEAATTGNGLKGTKTDDSDGHVPLSYALECVLRDHIKTHEITEARAFLFPSQLGTPMNPKNYLNRNLKPLAIAAGIPDGTLQCLRRTTATNAQHHGEVKSAQGLLRHASATTTLKHYIKTIPADVIDTANGWDSELNAIHCAACHRIAHACKCK